MSSNTVWGQRLKEARLTSGLSQKQLGIKAGLDPFVASTRINRYELGVHKADYQIAVRLAEVLGVPAAYFYAEDDALAEWILLFPKLSDTQREQVTRLLDDQTG